METRGFFDVFKRYQPKDDKRHILESAVSAVFRYKQEPMQVEVELTFPKHYPAETLYEIEDECRALYGAESFKIYPHFPSEEYNISRFDEICCEAAMLGAVTYGFFSNAEYRDDGECVTVSMPFFADGIEFVRASGTETVLSNILESRYGIKRKIVIKEGAGALEFENSMKERREAILEAAIKENEERARNERAAIARANEEAARLADPHYDFEARVGISSLAGRNDVLGGGVFRMGASTYSTEDTKLIFGDDFAISEPTPLSAVERAGGNTVFLGAVFDISSKESRGGDKINFTIGISDGACAALT